jgi:hypothetical protein
MTTRWLPRTPRALLTVQVVLLALRLAKADQRTQTFDNDPHWPAHNNRVKVEGNPVKQDFGYSATNHAKGKAAGEIGGRIQRCTTPSWFGKAFEKAKSWDEPLQCSGRFVVTQTNGMSSVYFGWFNTQTMDTRPRNFMGMMINGEGKGCEIHVSYNTAGGNSDGIRATGTGPKGAKVRDFNLIPVETVYTFDFAYDPAANGGVGQITFTLGGEGPFTGGPFKIPLQKEQRKAGATFDSFGFVNAQSEGNHLAMYVDDLSIDGEKQEFDADPNWRGEGNRAELLDYGREGAHQFGYSETAHAGGKAGEIGGLIHNNPSSPAYYADDIGKLSLDQPLKASGRIAVQRYGSDGAVSFGWFNSAKRGYPPANVLGILIDGPTSTGPRFEGLVGSSDSKLGHRQGNSAPLIAPDGKSHTWRIEYDPAGERGQGKMTIWLDEKPTSFALPAAVRKQGATFDRFGIFAHEGGGRACRVNWDDLEYTAAK